MATRYLRNSGFTIAIVEMLHLIKFFTGRYVLVICPVVIALANHLTSIGLKGTSTRLVPTKYRMLFIRTTISLLAS